MKIALIGQKGIPAVQGGVEKHVHDLSTRLVKFGHEVTVYARSWYTGSKLDFNFEGVKVKHLPSLKSKHFDTISHAFLATLHAMKNKSEVIHYHGVGPALVSWLPRIFTPEILVVTTFHSIDRYHKKWGWLARTCLRIGEWTACRFPHQTITISKSLEQYCQNEFHKKTTYIPNGITVAESFGAEEIKQFGLEKNQYLVMISRLVPHKGAHLLIKAFNQLKKNQPDHEAIRNLKLVIVGGSAYTDDYVKKLHQTAASNNNIIFTDFQSGETLMQLYANALALVHPSLNEGLPITVLQAMALARPVLVSGIPEHRELIHDNRFIFKENDIADLTQKLTDFLNLTETEKRQAGVRNLQIVEKDYDWDKLIEKINEVYQNPAPILIMSSRPS